ncbi:MAG: glycosyltransferase [Geminicoccaceae bacterium]
MIRSLIILDSLPYPPRGGQQLRYRQAIDALLPLGPVTLLLLADARQADILDEAVPPVLRLDPQVPRSWHYRWARLLGPLGKAAWRARLRRRHQAALQAVIAHHLAEIAPDLVLVESAELMTCLPPLAAPGRRVVYDAHNVERRLWGELVPLRGRLGGAPAKAGYGQRIVAGEAALLRSADQVWACSEEDALQFAQAYPAPLPSLRVIPNTVDTGAFAAIAAARAARRRDGPPMLLLTAHFGYAPNVEAARFLLDSVRPALMATIGPVRLVLCGRQPPPELLAAAAYDAEIVVTGEVADVRPWLAAADIAVAPLRTGSGTRLKILEAMAAACPVVSTGKGAEGLAVVDGEHLLLADEAGAFVAALRRCLDQPAEAMAMAMRGNALVERLYSWTANRARVRAALETG